MKQLRPYQKLIISHILHHKRCSIFASMGLGKTVSTLTAMVDLDLVENVYPVLVLAPLRVAKSTWPEEIREWAHLKHLRCSPIIGDASARIAACNTPADIYTMNYDNLEWLVNLYGERWPFVTIVADESTRLKSFRTRQGGVRTKALGTVAHTHVKRFINLTGTPAPNGLLDIWGSQWFVDAGKRLGRTFTAFKDRWFRPSPNGFGSVPHDFAQAQIEEAMRDVCLTVDAKDWFDLKEPIVSNRYVQLPPQARRLYDEMEKNLFMEIEGHEVEAFNAAAKTQKLLQVASGAVYVDPLTESDEDRRHSKEFKVVHDLKLDELESIIEEANGMPVLVAYHFKSDLARLLKRFKKGRALDANSQTIRDWNASKIPVLFAHPACLHPDTEVLTELRGWVKLIDVKIEERVFDGVEFVSHRGCSYSGYKKVIDVFGITMTVTHKLLVGNEWVEAKDVRDDKSTRERARYSYTEHDGSASEMSNVWDRKRDFEAKLRQAQSNGEKVQALPRANFSSNDRDTFLGRMDGYSSQNGGYERQELWGQRDTGMSRVGGLQGILLRYVRELCAWTNDRTDRCKWALQQGELPVGYQYGATSQQEKQQVFRLPRGEDTLSRGLSTVRSGQDEAMYSPSVRNDSGRSNNRCEVVDLRNEPKSEKKAHVYDLVDCGPRHRFLIRNDKGEMFISHNSAGHGLNLQHGGNILVFFSHDWNLENRLQIIERIGPVRQLQSGYDRPTFIYNIIGQNTADEIVIARVDGKKDVQDLFLQAMKRKYDGR